MAPVPVVPELPDLQETEHQPSEITFVTDMDAFSAENKCACAASDDNPY